jgi:hypothetical protein
MIIEEMRKERLRSYRPCFLDKRTGRTAKADYTVSLFPSEVEAKARELNGKSQNITVFFQPIGGQRRAKP